MELNVTSFFSGWISGNSIAFGRKKDEEAKQGKNYYISSLYHAAQVTALGQIAVELAKYTSSGPLKFSASVAANVLPILTIPFSFFAASVTHGHEKTVASKVNTYIDSTRLKKIPIRLPTTLSNNAKKRIRFINKNFSTIANTSFVAGTVLLFSLGNISFAAGALIISAYSIADSKGYVPHKISLFMEKYINVITFVGSLISGTIIVKATYMAYLLSYSKKVKVKTHQLTDLAWRKFVKKYNPKNILHKKFDPAIQDIEKPFKKSPKLSFDEMMTIVKADSDDFTINAAHCSRIVPELSKLPKDYKFKRLKSLFNAIDWENKYVLLKNSLKGDDRFIDYLIEQCEDESLEKETVQEDVETYILKVAQKENVSKEEFTANWVKEQMDCLVKILLKERAVKGTKQDLEEAIQYSSKVLAYLRKVDSDIEREDMLLRLAIEGGDYCARGIKRVSCDLANQILLNDQKNLDPQKAYEVKVNVALMNARKYILEMAYKTITQALNLPGVISDDTHAYDLYRIQLAYGFYPLSEYELDDFTFDKLIGWESLTSLREGMFRAYRTELHQAMKGVGSAHLGTYMYTKIQESKNLSDEQKDGILEQYYDNERGFEHLFLVMQGVLTYDFKKTVQ